jgi:hypothetical protein
MDFIITWGHISRYQNENDLVFSEEKKANVKYLSCYQDTFFHFFTLLENT